MWLSPGAGYLSSWHISITSMPYINHLHFIETNIYLLRICMPDTVVDGYREPEPETLTSPHLAGRPAYRMRSTERDNGEGHCPCDPDREEVVGGLWDGRAVADKEGFRRQRDTGWSRRWPQHPQKGSVWAGPWLGSCWRARRSTVRTWVTSWRGTGVAGARGS